MAIKRKLFWKIRWLHFIGPLLESRLISTGLFFVAEIPLVALLKLCVDYTEILVRYTYTNTCICFTHCAFISAASNYDYCLLLCRKLECSFFVLDKRWVIWIIYSLLSSTSLKKIKEKCTHWWLGGRVCVYFSNAYILLENVKVCWNLLVSVISIFSSIGLHGIALND